MNHLCTKCEREMVVSTTTISGVPGECYHCPQCKRKVFDMRQALSIARTIDAARGLGEYRKPIMEIGGSLAVTIPKPVADAFHLKGKNVKIKPLLSEGKIEISVME
ncbi:MAG: hypothetical protein AABX47_02725 [Nanoarchaeota archaeon]